MYLSGYKKLQDRFEQAKEKLTNVKTQKEEKQRYFISKMWSVKMRELWTNPSDVLLISFYWKPYINTSNHMASSAINNKLYDL